MVSNYREIPRSVCIYIKGQNERRAIRTLTAVVGGRVREDSDIRFARRLCS